MAQGVSEFQPIAYCETAKVLLEQYGEAVAYLRMLHENQFEAVIEQDSDATRFDILINEANEKRENSKYAYTNHLATHGCSCAQSAHLDDAPLTKTSAG